MSSAYDPSTEYSHWDAGLWTRVLAASGVRSPFTGEPFTEAMLAGLAGGIGFMIFTFEYKSITTASAVTRFHPGPYTENLLRRSGAAVNIQQTANADLAQARLDAALETGVPAVVRVVRGKLPWVVQDLLADVDSVDVAVLASEVGDGYLLDEGSGHLEPISSAALAYARGSRKADKHWQAHVVLAHLVRGSGAALTSQVLGRAMAETAKELLSQQAPPGVPPGYANNFGILGMQTWVQRLTSTSSKHGWMRIFGDPQRSLTGLEMLHGLLAGRRYSGPGALRPLYAQFLQEAALLTEGVPSVDLLGRPGMTSAAVMMDCARMYRKLGEHWEFLTGLVGAAGQDGTGRSADFAAMAKRLELIVELETQAAQALQDAAGTRL